MAPEMLFGKKYDSKVDVWGFGTLFYEMITGFIPFILFHPKKITNYFTFDGGTHNLGIFMLTLSYSWNRNKLVNNFNRFARCEKLKNLKIYFNKT